jgi:N utilization substance protein A
VQHLFQTEVPEIYDGTVQISSIAREAGERTKIAVTSRERDVDPVAPCVGMKGTRSSPSFANCAARRSTSFSGMTIRVAFATNAISPAKVSRVAIVDIGGQDHGDGRRRQPVVAGDRQEGQNVRLASKLIGWRIDIKSEEEKRAEIESQMSQMQESRRRRSKICRAHAGAASKAGIIGNQHVEQLADLAPEDLENIPGIGSKTVEKIKDVSVGVLCSAAFLSG